MQPARKSRYLLTVTERGVAVDNETQTNFRRASEDKVKKSVKKTVDATLAPTFEGTNKIRTYGCFNTNNEQVAGFISPETELACHPP